MTRGSKRVNRSTFSTLVHYLNIFRWRRASVYFSFHNTKGRLFKGMLVLIYKKNVNTLDFHSHMRDKPVRVRAQLTVEIHLHNSEIQLQLQLFEIKTCFAVKDS